MKVNLLIDNPHDVRSGYLNIDPFAMAEDKAGRVKGDISNLSHCVDDGEASEIVAMDILDYFDTNAADTVLANWLKKLALGGVMALSVIDAKEVARAICAGKLSPEEINDLVHGQQSQPWQFRKSSYTLAQLIEMFTNLGYRILKKRTWNYRAVIVIERTK